MYEVSTDRKGPENGPSSERTGLEERSRQVDEVVVRAFLARLGSTPGLGLLAVGGFGRRELFPHSDVDLLILSAGGTAEMAAKDLIRSFLQELWDAGLRIGHSVRTPAECCELNPQNVELNISLLDRRPLAGDAELTAELERRLPRFYQAQRQNLARHLCRLTRERHAKFHDTVFHLEPNIKEAPGGIRDLHVIAWLYQLLGSPSPDPSEGGEAADVLFDIRSFLHKRSKRDNNVLSFDAQDELAEARGADPAELMRDYFRAARAADRTVKRAMEGFEAKGSSLLSGFRDWRSRLSNAEFTVSRERLLLKSPQLFEQSPDAVLRLFLMVAKHGLLVHEETERRIRGRLADLERHFAEPNQAWKLLREILNAPKASMALRAMNETGVLGAMFPAWRNIESFVIRDFNHRYTVDEHTVVTIENLEKLPGVSETGLRRYGSLATEIETQAPLRFALLFHDVGKGEEGESHSVSSARLAREAGNRIGMPKAEVDLAVLLIEQHLVLSSAMSGRDLDDPATARWLADRVGTVEAAKCLTLLTYADISAVNPAAMSPWRADQLWRVYTTVYRELTRELDTDRIAESTPGGQVSLEAQQFLKGFPARYLRTHSPAEIEEHLQLERQRRDAGIAVDIRRVGADYQLTVLSKDRMYLFAALAGSLASFGMNILKAEAFANQQGTILDTFAFSDPKRTIELNPPELDRLRQTIERVASGKLEVQQLLRHRRSAPPPSRKSLIEGSVAFDGAASETATLVEVTAQDRPGLLYELAEVFSASGCSIEVVLVDTEAHKAIDVFYVTTSQRKLSTDQCRMLEARLLGVCRAPLGQTA